MNSNVVADKFIPESTITNYGDTCNYPVLFMSGYAEEQLRNEIGITNMHFLPKPFSVAQISDKVGAVLGAG